MGGGCDNGFGPEAISNSQSHKYPIAKALAPQAPSRLGKSLGYWEFPGLAIRYCPRSDRPLAASPPGTWIFLMIPVQKKPPCHLAF